MSGNNTYHIQPGTQVPAPSDFVLALTDIVRVARPVGEGYEVYDVPASKLATEGAVKRSASPPTQGVLQAKTYAVTVSGGALVAGTAHFTLAGAALTTGPVTVDVAVTDNETDAAVATTLAAALSANASIAAHYTVSRNVADVTVTAKASAANDTSLTLTLATYSHLTVVAGAATPGMLGSVGDYIGQLWVTTAGAVWSYVNSLTNAWAQLA